MAIISVPDNQPDLVSALIAANGNADAENEIILQSGTINLTIYDGLRGADYVSSYDGLHLTNGLPVIKKHVTIRGAGRNTTLITRTGSERYRFFYVEPGCRLSLEDLTLSNGDVGDNDTGGGLILNQGTLFVEDCTLGPYCRSNYGGAILNISQDQPYRKAQVVRCDVFGGDAAWGGGIYNAAGCTLAIEDSTIRDNRGNDGGGVLNMGTAYISRSNFFGNRAIFGGAVGNYNGMTTMEYCLLSTNNGQGAAIYNRVGSVQAVVCNILDNRPEQGIDTSILNDDPSNTVDVRDNWWGRTEGPYAQDIGTGNIVFSPWQTSSTPTRCQLQDGDTQEVYRGPSKDDLKVNAGSLVFPVPALYRAEDELGQTWYGFSHPDRPGAESWIEATNVTLSGEPSDLPWHNTRAYTGTYVGLTLQRMPIEPFDRSRICQGFALKKPDLYPTAPCQCHWGFDFFPPETSADVTVLVAADGIVVGIGNYRDIYDYNEQTQQWEDNLSGEVPAAWGAVEPHPNANAPDGGYNIVIRTGKYYTLYGHLRSVNPLLYLGKQVTAGDVLGELAKMTYQGQDNTHLHLEVRGYTLQSLVGQPLRCRFGAIKKIPTTSSKPLVIDPMQFVSTAGSCTGDCDPGLPYDDENLNTYTNAELALSTGIQQFDYVVPNGREGQVHNTQSNAFRTFSPFESDSNWKVVADFYPDHCS